MAKQPFQNGMLDKAGKNVKTDKGWVPVKGNEHLIDKELNKGREIVPAKEKTPKPEKPIKEKKQTKKAEEEEQTLTRKDKHKEDEKWRWVKDLKNKIVERENLPNPVAKAELEFYDGNIKILKDDLKKQHDYVMDETEAKTKYQGEKVIVGDTVFIGGEKRKVTDVDDDNEGFIYKTQSGQGQGTIHTMDERPAEK